MSAPTVPTSALVHGVDVDEVARAALACPGVEGLLGGSPDEVATYLAGRRLLGVQVSERCIDVHVRAAWGASEAQIAAAIRAAVAPVAGGRAVDVTIADLGDPLAAGSTGVSPVAANGWP